jgi:excisionase family DNA binding protein
MHAIVDNRQPGIASLAPNIPNMRRLDPKMGTAMDKLWTPQELADFLGVPLQTVYQWRSKRRGPRGIRVGRHIRYRPATVTRWLDEQQRFEETKQAS